jgi:hypothetical protein
MGEVSNFSLGLGRAQLLQKPNNPQAYPGAYVLSSDHNTSGLGLLKGVRN